MATIYKKKYKKGSGRGCCIPKCKNREGLISGIKFYGFPNRPWEVERKQKWINFVNREGTNNIPWAPSKYSRICGVHFFGGEKSNDPRKEAYNPTIFPIIKQHPVNGSHSRKVNKIIITLNREVGVQTHAYLNETDEEPGITLFCWQDSSTKEASTQTHVVINNCHREQKQVIIIKTPDKYAPEGSNSIIKIFYQWIYGQKTDSCLRQLGGITLAFFDILLNFIELNSHNQLFKNLTREDKLVLFLMKMKSDLDFVPLACLFRIEPEIASNVFYNILETLYFHTKTWICWPKECLPVTFRNYRNCRAMIDCIELYCETPNTEMPAKMMYSTYKSHFILKYLIASTPSGDLCFISKGYGGQTTDCFTVNDSGFFTLIEPGDEILGDNGFSGIEKDLWKRKCKLIKFTNPQFSREATLMRRHIERSIEKIRTFKILDYIPVNLMSQVDKIMHVACVLANNKKPLICKSEYL